MRVRATRALGRSRAGADSASNSGSRGALGAPTADGAKARLAMPAAHTFETHSAFG